MISLRYGFICDYCAEGQLGKAIAIGIYDVIGTTQAGPIKLPKHYLHLRIEGQGDIGPRHIATIRLIDADARPVAGAEMEWTFQFVRRDDGLGLWCNLNIFVDHHLEVADYGSYSWVVMVDGLRIGELPLSVFQLQEQKAPAT